MEKPEAIDRNRDWTFTFRKNGFNLEITHQLSNSFEVEMK